MRNLILFAILFSSILFSNCGETKKEEVIIPGMKQVDLIINGNPLTIYAPDSTIGPMQIIEKSYGATEITVGDKFNISIEEAEGDIALLKSDIEMDDVYKLQNFVRDEPNLLFWEVKILDMDGSKFHFYNIIKTGNTSYVIKDIETGESYSKASIEKMLESAATLKAKDVVPPDA